MAEIKEILIVEDSKAQAMKLQYILERNNYSVISARNGVEAMDSLYKHKPSLVITDIIMPEMDGFELCRRIRADESLKDIPVVLLTAFPDHKAIIKSLESGADNFVTKPYKEVFLLSQIRYILNNLDARRKINQEDGIMIHIGGEQHHITATNLQIIDLLFSVFENSLQKTRELEETNKALTEALDKIKTLQGFIPICMHCKKIRNDKGFWEQVETYISSHSEAEFSHGLCPDCAKEIYPHLIEKA